LTLKSSLHSISAIFSPFRGHPADVPLNGPCKEAGRDP
jgi:hypothetical protein